MRKILISFATAASLVLFGVSGAWAEGFGIGVTGSVVKLDTTGSETEGGEKNSKSIEHTFPLGEVFVEYGVGNLTLGVNYVPYDMDVSSKIKQRDDVETSVTSTADETTTARTQKASAEITDHTSIYAEYMLGDRLFLKGGYLAASVNTDESLDTGSKYGNVDVNGWIVGAGLKGNFGRGFAKLALEYTDYEDISLTSSVARTGVSTNNKIEADMDSLALKLSLGF